MNEDVEKLWTDALRSGEYEQGKYVLFDGEKYCCLGVLCLLHQKETGGSWDAQDARDEGCSRKYLNEIDVLPEAVVEWAGLSSDIGGWDPESGYSLTDLNDRGT